jgi:hypothetical protein
MEVSLDSHDPERPPRIGIRRSRIAQCLLVGGGLSLFSPAAVAWEVEATAPDSFGHSSLTITGDIIDANSGEALVVTCISVNWLLSTEGWTPERFLALPRSAGRLSLQAGGAAISVPVHGIVWNNRYAAYAADGKDSARRVVALLRSKSEFISVSLALVDGTRDEGKVFGEEKDAAMPDRFDAVCNAE